MPLTRFGRPWQKEGTRERFGWGGVVYLALTLAYLAGPCTRPSSGIGCTAGLFRWLADQGGRSQVTCTTRDSLRGLVATSGVGPGATLLEVPLGATLGDGCTDIVQVPFVATAPSWAKNLPWNVQLAIGILLRRGQDEWKPFLDSWPRSPPLLPKDLDDEELEEAQDEDLEVKAGSVFFWLEERYEDAREAYEAQGISDPFPWDEDDFRWALGHVWSRCCRFDLGSQGGVRRLLVPVFDLANHVAEPNAVFDYNATSSCGPAICLYATRDILEGEAVTLCYGEHPNLHFLLYYGFVPLMPPNPHDFVSVSLVEILEALPFEAPQRGWRAAVQASGFPAVLDLRASGPPKQLLDAFQVLLWQGEEASDARVLQAVASACKALEAKHETTLEEDEDLLQANGSADAQLSAGVRLLLQYRIGRKRLLRDLCIRCGAQADALEAREAPASASTRVGAQADASEAREARGSA